MNEKELLNNIFDTMQDLYDKTRLRKTDDGNHIEIFEIFAELGKKLAGADRASFWRWDKNAHKLITNAATDTEQIIIDDTSGLVGKALAENKTIVTNDPKNHPNFNSAVDEKTSYKTKSILVMPVSNCRGEIIGAFQVINKLDENGFDEVEDQKRLSIAAFICGLALESDLFLDASQRDKLTQLKNRFGLYDDFKNKYKKNPLSIVICDIDFFKKVNDTYGHNAGDEVLKNVAQILSDEVKNFGNAYRWGGEEFIIVLENANISETEKIAEKIRLTAMNFVHNFEGEKISVTMSFGCAEFDNSLTVEENINIADARLYNAKKSGRNRVISRD